jgi:hypothetical protein
MCKKTVPLLFCLFVLFVSNVSAWNIKIIDSSGIDATDMKSLVSTITSDCDTDQQKMESMWAFITRNPFYHWCEAREGQEADSEFGLVYDPIKAFNVYGTIICYQVADLLANMALEAGIPSRTRSFPYKHKVMEAYFDGGWHLFDAQSDCQAIYYKADGKTIASLDEVDADPQYYLIDQPNPSQPFFQFEKFAGNCWPWEVRQWVKENWYEHFPTEQLERYLPFDQQGHRMLLSLRRGEKLVRYWDNERKWYCTPVMQKTWNHDLTQQWVALGPHDPRNALNTYANGKLIYNPDWNASSENFFDGLHEGSNYRLVDGKVCPAEAGELSQVSFRVSSPYLLAGHPNRLGVDGDSEGGAIFRAVFHRQDESSSAKVSVSVDEGLSWIPVWRDSLTGTHPVKLDLTNHVEGRYSYILRVELNAASGKKIWFSGMELENSLFYSPILLPTVGEGENQFSVELSEAGEQLCLEPDFSSLEALEPFCYSIDNLRFTGKLPERLTPEDEKWGSLVAEVDPVGGSLISELAVYGSFGIDPQAEGEDSIRVFFAEDAPEKWIPAWEYSTKALDKSWDSGYSEEGRIKLAEHWRLDKSIEVRPTKPCNRMYVKFMIKRKARVSLNNFRVYAYYQPERPSEMDFGDIVITHAWTEDGEARIHTENLASSSHAYTLSAADSLVVNQSITVEMKNIVAQ